MKTFSALLAISAGNSPVTGEFPTQRPVTRSFDVFFGMCLNKRLSKQSWGWWFETPSRPLWRHCDFHPDDIRPNVNSPVYYPSGRCPPQTVTRTSWFWPACYMCMKTHYNDVIMSSISSQITSPTIVYSTVYSVAIQRQYQSPASLAYVREIHR